MVIPFFGNEAWWKRNREKNKLVVFLLIALALVVSFLVISSITNSYS